MGELTPCPLRATTFIVFRWAAKAHAALTSTRFMERPITSAFSTLVRHPRILTGGSSRQRGVISVARCRRKKNRERLTRISSLAAIGAAPLGIGLLPGNQ